jgi:hypothetical protein
MHLFWKGYQYGILQLFIKLKPNGQGRSCKNSKMPFLPVFKGIVSRDYEGVLTIPLHILGLSFIPLGVSNFKIEIEIF